MDSRVRFSIVISSIIALCIFVHFSKAMSTEKLPCPKQCKCSHHLTIVKCSHQKLTTLPAGIPLSTENLDLSFNNLPYIVPTHFQNFSQLVVLDLRSNKIASIANHSFVKQIKMTTLVLTNNDLGKIENDAFKGAASLSKLYLTSNRLSQVPSLTGLKVLEKLTIDTNQIIHLVFPDEFNTLPALNYINIANNKIASLTNDSFINLRHSNIRKLSLSRNHIRSIDVDTFSPLKSIESLKLSFNPLTSEDLHKGLSGLSGSKILSLDISNLTFANELPASTFELLVNSGLNTLILDYNHFNQINNNAFKTLSTLQTLKLNYCSIQSISKLAFHGLVNLNKLFLTHNELFEIKWDFPQQLQFLYLDNNKIQVIPKAAFGKLVKLRELFLTYNKIHEFHKNAFVGLEQLQKLRLAHNSISTIPSPLFSSLVGLESLELQSNSIANLPNTTFASMTQLMYLNLANNNLRFISPSVLSPLQQLRYLFLSHNTLGNPLMQNEFNHLFSSLTKLNTLDLSNNQIQGILSKETFKNLRNLEILRLSKNQISSWEVGTFFPMSNLLKNLDLSQNHVTTILEINLENLKELKVLELSKNPFACNCQLRWFRDWLKNTTVFIPDLKEIKCNSPKSWQGKDLLDFDRSKIDCTDYTPYYIYGGAAAGLVLTMLLLSVMYTYRWYIRFHLYMLNKKIQGRFYRQQGYAEFPRNDIVYDMNITYTDSDLGWVLENVMRPFDNGEFGDYKFEGEFKLCLMDRDNELGPVMSSILQNMEHSKQVLVVLSKNFTNDRRCTFELEYSFDHFKYERSKVIVVTVGELGPRDIPRILKGIFKESAFIAWEDNDNAKRLFQQKIQDALMPKQNE